MSIHETEPRFDIRSPVELRRAYPEGMIVYFQPNSRQRARVQDVLTRAFPDRFIYTAYAHNAHWPADAGTQIGSSLYTDGAAGQYIREALHEMTSLNSYDFIDLLPPERDPHIEGGLTVPVGGTRCIGYSTAALSEKMEWNVFGLEHVPAIRMITVASALEKLHMQEKPNSSSYSQKWVNTVAKDSIFRGTHIDCLITAFVNVRQPDSTIHWYMDDTLHMYARETIGALDPSLSEVQPFPHEYTLRGGLNIAYVNSGNEWTALVPSLSAIGPLAMTLQSSGYRVIELGDEEFVGDGGVKCRMLSVRWSA